MSSGFSYVLTATAALAAVLGLIWLVQRAARFGGLVPARAATARRLGVEEAVAIDPHRRLHLIRCDRRQVLILTGGSQDLLIGWLPPEGPEP